MDRGPARPPPRFRGGREHGRFRRSLPDHLDRPYPPRGRPRAPLAEPPAGFSVTAAGEYLALRDEGDRPEGPAPPELLANLDEGLISLSLDAARLLEKHRATAWIALGAMRNEIEAEVRA